MTERRMEEPAAQAGAVPRDLPDQQVGGTVGDRDPWDVEAPSQREESGGRREEEGEEQARDQDQDEAARDEGTEASPAPEEPAD
jgi:hypothetical protein